jgi:hypothetical protein
MTTSWVLIAKIIVLKDCPSSNGGISTKGTFKVAMLSSPSQEPSLARQDILAAAHGVGRPGYGNAGRQIKLFSNHVEVKLDHGMIYHYDGIYLSSFSRRINLHIFPMRCHDIVGWCLTSRRTARPLTALSQPSPPLVRNRVMRCDQSHKTFRLSMPCKPRSKVVFLSSLGYTTGERIYSHRLTSDSNPGLAR